MNVVSATGLPQGMIRQEVTKPITLSLLLPPKKKAMLTVLKDVISSRYPGLQGLAQADLFCEAQLLADFEEASAPEALAQAMASLSQSLGNDVVLFQDSDGDLFLTGKRDQITGLKSNNSFTEVLTNPANVQPALTTSEEVSSKAAQLGLDRQKKVALFDQVQIFGRSFRSVLALSGHGGTAMWAALAQYLGIFGNSQYAALRIYIDDGAAAVMKKSVSTAIGQISPQESVEDYLGRIMYGLLSSQQIKVLQNKDNPQEILLVATIGRLRQRFCSGELENKTEPFNQAFVPSEAQTNEHDALPMDPEQAVNIRFVHLAGGLLYPGEGAGALGTMDFISAEQVSFFSALIGLLNCYNKQAFPCQGMKNLKLFLSIRARDLFLQKMRQDVPAIDAEWGGTPLMVKGVVSLFTPLLEGGAFAVFRSKADPNLVLCIQSDEAETFPQGAAFDRVACEPGTFEQAVFSPPATNPPRRMKQLTPESFFVDSTNPEFISHKMGRGPQGGASPYKMIQIEGEERRMFLAGLEKSGFAVSRQARLYCDESMSILLGGIFSLLRSGNRLNASFEKQVAMVERELTDASDLCLISHFKEGGEGEVFFSSKSAAQSPTPQA